MASSSSGPVDLGGSRVFSGEEECGKEYRRWKVWVSNKLLTLKEKIPNTATGAYVYTLLAGKALEAVEHLEPETYQVADGEKALFKLLDERFPQKDSADELSENMTKVFELRANTGETMKQWISRATEAFDLLQRKAAVSFPSEARGWLILNRSGLNAEQRAVVLARSVGNLKYDEIGRSLRSCYPDFIVPKRSTFGAGLVADEGPFDDGFEDDTSREFDDVEQFLADHSSDVGEDTVSEPFEESEVKEILAATWQEKRKSLSRLQKQRKFHDAGQVRRQFRVEVEELKKRTRCHRCQQLGHWSRECRNPPVKGSGKGSKTASSVKSDAGAAMVEHFVALVWSNKTMSQILSDRRQELKSVSQAGLEEEQLLVSSPGYGVLDSGCGKTIVGMDTFNEFTHLWTQHGMQIPEPEPEVNHFRFGNGSRKTSSQVVSMPVVLAGRPGFIKAALVKGSAPLLISRSAMKTLKAQVDFGRSELKIFDEELKVPLRTNAAGQFVVYLLGQSEQPEIRFQEVMNTEYRSDVQDAVVSETDAPQPSREVEPDALRDVADPVAPSVSCPSKSESKTEGPVAVWSRTDHGLQYVPITGKQGPCWHQIIRRKVINLDNDSVVVDQVIDHTVPKTQYHVPVPQGVRHFRTEFHFVPQERVCPTECLPVHHVRQLTSALRSNHKYPGTYVRGKRFLVAEVFSPPRLSPIAESMGFAAKSYDLINGFDFRVASQRDAVKKELKENPPDLLLVCPPCTHEGGWWNLNCHHLPLHERLKKQRESRLYIRFCCDLYEQQIASGRMALFEHPKGAKTWSYPEVKRLIDQCFLVRCHMCRYGLRLPKSPNLIRKSTNLLVSHSHMKELGLTCPGKSHPDHHCHDTVAGTHEQVGSVSRFSGQYTPAFADAVLRQVPQYVRAVEQSLVHVCDHEDVGHPFVTESLAAQREDLKSEDEESIRKALAKLHKNLGHPSNSDLVRILRHGQASEAAINLAKQFTCDFCKSQIRPHVPLPAQSGRVTQFNQVVGIDVKNLTGWLPNQKIKALNIVDQGSCYQQMIPFFEQETAQVLQKLFAEYWVRWAGPPEVVIMDQAQTQLGEVLQSYLENMGSSVKLIAAGAHWQLGRTENHGGWFSRIVDRLLEEHSPSNREEWEECVRTAHVKNQSIQSYGYTPQQHVFGKNPTLPGDLLSEPLHVVPGTAGLSDDAVARAQALRCTARQAVVAMQDDKALRSALSARPRITENFRPGDLVAYWRQQKFTKGTLVLGGRWYGVAVVIGHVGKNVLIAHRRQIFRCAPEQLRFATTEERATVETPEMELLGIKDMIEGGTFRSNQYIDLVPGHYPTQADAHDKKVVPVASQSVPFQSVPSTAETSEPAGSAMPSTAPDQPPNMEVDAPKLDEASPSPEPASASGANEKSLPAETPSSYGPVRRRVSGKAGDPALYRPPKMKESDFIDMMSEIVPKLLVEATQSVSTGSASGSSHGVKRDHSAVSAGDDAEPPASKPKPDDGSSLCVVHEHDCLLVDEVLECWNEGGVEALMAAHLQKKLSKELPPSGNDGRLQTLVDESKSVEWNTLLEKGAIKIHYGKRAHKIKQDHPDRFMGSRFVIIRKALEEGRNVDVNDESSFKVKSRWCLQGHLDPDLDSKALEGLLQSPTLSQMGRTVLMQLLASYKWGLQLGDIKGAFMEAGPLPSKYRPLFAHQPKGGIPGLPHDAVIEVVGNVYGQNDAPYAWFSTFNTEAIAAGWVQSKFDSCLYYLRDSENRLKGVLGVHVDDTACGGEGPLFEEAISKLKRRFPYRKWRTGSGEFCGAFYSQDPSTFEISMNQSQFAEGLRVASINKGAIP